MKEKENPRRSQRLLLFLHTLLWLISWGFGIYFAPIMYTFIPGIVLFFWTLVFILHCLFYATSASRANAHERERQAYRDGFNDALRHLQDQDISRFQPTHRLDEDDELIEWEAESKRKHSP
jgi:ABC-type transport system involved in cytochrome bd biosynthesis fused ATPase/permease subunit